MLRDTSQQQVVQKFSFIESLNLSRGVDRGDREILDRLDIERASDFVPQITAKSPPQNPQTSSVITTSSNCSTTIDTNLERFNSDARSLSLAKVTPDSASNPTNNPKPKNHNYLGKILFALACSYGVFTLWWLFGHYANRILTTLTGGKQIALSKSDVEFIDYMERSLVAIEQQSETNKSDANGDSEVVYVPVYTPNSNLSSNNHAATIPQPVAIAQPKPTPSPQALKIPTPPPLPEPTPIPANSQSPTPEIAAVNTQPAIKHTLTGILDLGADKSAALIKINGQTRRFWLGEQIGDSDWILKSVSDRAAKISNQGQVRSIAVGETF